MRDLLECLSFILHLFSGAKCRCNPVQHFDHRWSRGCLYFALMVRWALGKILCPMLVTWFDKFVCFCVFIFVQSNLGVHCIVKICFNLKQLNSHLGSSTWNWRSSAPLLRGSYWRLFWQECLEWPVWEEAPMCFRASCACLWLLSLSFFIFGQNLTGGRWSMSLWVDKLCIHQNWPGVEGKTDSSTTGLRSSCFPDAHFMGWNLFWATLVQSGARNLCP